MFSRNFNLLLSNCNKILPLPVSATHSQNCGPGCCERLLCFPLEVGRPLVINPPCLPFHTHPPPSNRFSFSSSSSHTTYFAARLIARQGQNSLFPSTHHSLLFHPPPPLPPPPPSTTDPTTRRPLQHFRLRLRHSYSFLRHHLQLRPRSLHVDVVLRWFLHDFVARIVPSAAASPFETI